MQNLTLIPNPKAKLKKKHSTTKLFTKNCPFASCFKINLYFSQIRLQIWNENKILRILVPILTYFNTNYFFQNTVQIFFSQVGQYGYPKTQNFMLIPNLKMKLRKSAPIKSYFKKLAKKQFFENNFFVMRFFLILPSYLESV